MYRLHQLLCNNIFHHLLNIILFFQIKLWRRAVGNTMHMHKILR